jgi:lambda repressor-like predicted transcriptional regulator
MARRAAELGWSYSDLGRMARVHPNTAKNVLTGRCGKGQTVKALAHALGLNLSDLVVDRTAGNSTDPTTGEERQFPAAPKATSPKPRAARPRRSA